MYILLGMLDTFIYYYSFSCIDRQSFSCIALATVHSGYSAAIILAA